MRTKRKQKAAARNAQRSPPLEVFPGLECEQEEEQEALNNYCIETDCWLAEKEWNRLGREYEEWLGLAEPNR